MRVQPRQQLLQIWESVVRASWQDGKWVWGGRDGSNSISDAEQLLCLLLPATQVSEFNLDRPDRTSETMVRVLRSMGTATDIPRVLVRVLSEYFTKYTDDAGAPIFGGGSYFGVDLPGDTANGRRDDDEFLEEAATKDQLGLGIVDSFAMSVTLSLATIGFVRVFRRSVTRDDIRQQIETLEGLASVRLSAAMIGLLRSFSVNVFTVDSPEGRALCRTANQSRVPQRVVVHQLQQELRETIASFREVLIGSGQTTDLESSDRLFECGWSWGTVTNAPEIETLEKVGEQPVGLAEDKPYLYFTVIALDAIEDLFSERTRILGLLNEEQQRLTRALQLRWDLTRAYWATVATFGDGRRWPLEDIPWQTTDEDASEYYTLQVTSLAVKGLVRIRGTDAELSRVGRVLSTLAERARITSRPTDGDANLKLHTPGVRLRLLGSESLGGPQLRWTVSEFAALLLQRSSGIAALLSDAEQRGALMELSDEVWEHLSRRRLGTRIGTSLWDQPAAVFTESTVWHEQPSWYYTERVVQGLVTTAGVLNQPPIRSARLITNTMDLLREAEHIYDRELLSGGAEGGPQLQETLRLVEITLRRAREIVQDKPGTAAALANDMLRLLDRLAAARRDVTEET